MKVTNLPPLDHPMGYFREMVVNILEERLCIPELFFEWMGGQTVGYADGKTLYYVYDLVRYLTQGGLLANVTD